MSQPTEGAADTTTRPRTDRRGTARYSRHIRALRKGGDKGHKAAHLHHRRQLAQRPRVARLRHNIRMHRAWRRQPRGDRRLYRARNDAQGEHPAHPRPPAPEEDCRRVVGSADTLPRLLRHRHAASGGVLCLSCHHRTDTRAWYERPATARLRGVQARTAQTQKHDAQLRARHIQTFHSGGDKPKSGRYAPTGRSEDTGRTRVPVDRRTA